MSAPTVWDHVESATARLVAVGLTRRVAALDAEVLARHVLGWTRATYLASRRDAAPSDFVAPYAQALERRERREPVALITGVREFWGLDFEVTPAVLTPRPETELLIEEVLALTPASHAVTRLRIADVGTGSGCLAVALSRELPTAIVIATDVSARALDVARRNARRHGVDGRIRWIQTRLLDGVTESLDAIVANLPYVPAADLGLLAPEVRDYEPREALAGGIDGLDAVSALLSCAPERLVEGGHLVIEFGAGQHEAVHNLVSAEDSLELVRISRDLRGIRRAAVIRRSRHAS